MEGKSIDGLIEKYINLKQQPSNKEVKLIQYMEWAQIQQDSGSCWATAVRQLKRCLQTMS